MQNWRIYAIQHVYFQNKVTVAFYTSLLTNCNCRLILLCVNWSELYICSSLCSLFRGSPFDSLSCTGHRSQQSLLKCCYLCCAAILQDICLFYTDADLLCTYIRGFFKPTTKHYFMSLIFYFHKLDIRGLEL